MTQKDMRGIVVEEVAEYIGEPAGHIMAMTTLDDLGFDSLDRIELAMVLEERFDTEIDDDVYENWNTVADIFATLEGK
jgi:acyl carrier protein